DAERKPGEVLPARPAPSGVAGVIGLPGVGTTADFPRDRGRRKVWSGAAERIGSTAGTQNPHRRHIRALGVRHGLGWDAGKTGVTRPKFRRAAPFASLSVRYGAFAVSAPVIGEEKDFVSAEEIGGKIGHRVTKAALWIGGAVTVSSCAWWTFTLIFDGIPLSR